MPKPQSYQMTGSEYLAFRAKGMKFRPAFLSETMGPNWKPIYWLIMGDNSKRPMIRIQ